MPNDHYYTSDPQSKHRTAYVDFSYRGRNLRFETDSGVFSRTEADRGSQILLDSLPDPLTGKILDMGCGWGLMGVSIGAAYPAASVTMADVNRRALSLAVKNATAAGISAEALESDGFSAIRGRHFGTIVLNPPIRAGKSVIYKMFADAADALEPNGSLWLVIRKQQGAPSAQKYLETLYNSVQIPEKDAGYWIFECSQPIEQNGVQP